MTAPGTQLGVVAAGHPVSAGAGRRRAARRRQRGRRRAGRDAGVVRVRAAADRPGRGRLHAGRRAGPAADAAGLLRRGARTRSRPRGRARSSSRSGLVRRRDPGVQHRRRVGGHVRHAGRGVRGGAAGSAGCRWSELVDAGRAAGPRRRASSTPSRPTSSRSSAGSSPRRPRPRRCSRPTGELLRAGERLRQPELADALERLGAEGSRPFYEGDIAAAIVDWVAERGGLLTAADLAAYEVVDREPVRVGYRGRDGADQPAAVGRRDPDRASAGDARRRARPPVGRASSSR